VLDGVDQLPLNTVVVDVVVGNVHVVRRSPSSRFRFVPVRCRPTDH
jgi:hypothetical protein